MIITILIFIFFRIFFIHIFWVNLVPQAKVCQINWNLVQAYIAVWFLRFSCPFFQYFRQSYFLKFRLKIWSFPNWLQFCAGVHCYLLITNVMFIFSKFCHSYNFVNLVPKWKVICWLQFWCVIFWSICRS